MKKVYSLIICSIVSFIFSYGTLNAQGIDYYLKAAGTITDVASWGDFPDGSGTAPADFSQGDIWHITNNASITLASTWSLSSGEQVVIGDGTSAISFTLASGGAFGLAFPFSWQLMDKATFVLNTPYNLVFGQTLLDPGSTFIYGAGASTLEKDSYHNLVINNNVAVATGGGTVVVNGTLTINSGFSIDLTGNIGRRLRLNGTIAGSGTLKGDNLGSTLILAGTGDMGILNFEPNFETLTIMTVQLATASSSVSISTDLAITGTVTGNGLRMVSGIFNLHDPVQGGHNLTINNQVIFTANGGKFGGGTAAPFQSSIHFLGAISGSMLMESTANTLDHLLLKSSGVTLTLGNQLNIQDSISPNAGTLAMGANNLRLLSSGSIKGRLGRLGASSAVTGTMTVETFIPSGITGWGQIGISGVQGQLVSDWEDDIPMTCVNCPFNEMATGVYFVSINSYTEATEFYDTTITYTTPLPPGQGFWVFLGNSAAGTTGPALTLVNTGAAVTGSLSIPITQASGGANSGWNLVANPYASPIDWDDVLNMNNTVGGTIFSWGSNGDESYVFGSATSGFSPSGELPMGQGFYVECTGGAASSMVFDESVKTSNSNNPQIIKRPGVTIDPGKQFRLKIKGNNLDFDDMVFRIHADATLGFDKKFDAKKFFTSPGYVGYPGTYSQYTSISAKDPQENDYSIISVPVLSQSLTIPILAKAMLSGQFTITATEYDDIENCLLLKDKLTGSIHDLKSGPLVITLSDTTSAPRFELMMCRDANPVGIKELKASNSIFINQDAEGAFVRTNFDEPTTAVISAYNIIGQKLMEDVTVEGTANTTRLNLGVHNQVVVIKVTTEKESVVKKMVAH
jgi:hypothetical protein